MNVLGGMGGLIPGLAVLGGAHSEANRQQEFLTQQHLQAMSAYYQQQMLSAFGVCGNPQPKENNCINCGAPRNAAKCSYCGTQ